MKEQAANFFSFLKRLSVRRRVFIGVFLGHVAALALILVANPEAKVLKAPLKVHTVTLAALAEERKGARPPNPQPQAESALQKERLQAALPTAPPQKKQLPEEPLPALQTTEGAQKREAEVSAAPTPAKTPQKKASLSIPSVEPRVEPSVEPVKKEAPLKQAAQEVVKKAPSPIKKAPPKDLVKDPVKDPAQKTAQEASKEASLRPSPSAQKEAPVKVAALPAKKPEPAKRQEGKERDPPKGDPVQQERRRQLLAEARQTLGRLEDSQEKKGSPSKRSSSQSSRGSSEKNAPFELSALSAETLLAGDDGSFSLESQERDYFKEITASLKRQLKLPEIGTVKVELILLKDGRVEALKVISSDSQKNQEYVVRKIPLLQLPSLPKKMPSLKQERYKISIIFDNA